MYNMTAMLDVDEIDHLNIRVRQGKPYDKDLAIKLVKKNLSLYEDIDEIKELQLSGYDNYDNYSEEELMNLLIKIRNIISDKVVFR